MNITHWNTNDTAEAAKPIMFFFFFKVLFWARLLV